VRTVKDRLASWRHSAHTATIERRSKVIDGRIHDARRAEKRRMKPAQGKEIAAFIDVLRANPDGRLFRAGILLSDATRTGHNAAFATFLPASELEQSAFVAFSSKNGLHRAARRLAGKPDARAGRRAVQ